MKDKTKKIETQKGFIVSFRREGGTEWYKSRRFVSLYYALKFVENFLDGCLDQRIVFVITFE